MFPCQQHTLIGELASGEEETAGLLRRVRGENLKACGQVIGQVIRNCIGFHGQRGPDIRPVGISRGALGSCDELSGVNRIDLVGANFTLQCIRKIQRAPLPGAYIVAVIPVLGSDGPRRGESYKKFRWYWFLPESRRLRYRQSR